LISLKDFPHPLTPSPEKKKHFSGEGEIIFLPFSQKARFPEAKKFVLLPFSQNMLLVLGEGVGG